MTDFVPKGAGNSRYLKSVSNFSSLYPTYDDFSKAMVAGTLPVDFNGFNSAGCTQLGTKLNKANLLDDDTASALELTSSDPTVNEALYALNQKRTFNIGDILVTIDGDPGDEWALCNGAVITPDTFPGLAEAFGAWGSKTLLSGASTDYSYTRISSITYANGYWVAVGQYYDGSTHYARIVYATSPDGTWTTKDFWTWSSNSNAYGLNSIIYANGYWVAVGQYYNDSGYCVQIAYATSPDGTWTTKSLWSSSNYSAYTINSIIYANGYWVAVGQYYNGSTYYARIAYATSPDGTWTTKNLWSGSGVFNGIYSITYANGYWVAGGQYYNGSTPSYYYARLAYATSPDGTWTTKSLWSGSSDFAYPIRFITYANGYWVAGGSCCDSNYYTRIAYATSPDGTWTTKNLWNSGSNFSNYIYSVTYANGYWVVGGMYYDGSTYYTRIAYATSPDGTWTTKSLWSSSKISNFVFTPFTYANGYWVVGGMYYDGSNYHAQIAYATSPDGTWTTKSLWSGSSQYNYINSITYADGYWVAGGQYYVQAKIMYNKDITIPIAQYIPEISVDNAYAYIKVE